ncbi:MAG: acetylglutamate kinase [Deltaproteobacteria bacterium]|nr:MAG: acetylglutamate kinase [Deltaproteobacteria bacterium]TDJ16261.1 MAG: acetylglutamate kinase [Deltaproteobacteria bacterium]
MKQLIDKAEVLIEALPYIQRFYDKTIVIKYGGSAMLDEEFQNSFAVDVVLLKYVGLRPVLVHGGGPQIEATLARLGKKSKFADGLRVTDDETMEVVEMVLGGKVNRAIVSMIQRGGGRAIGLTGSDGDMIRVTQRLVDDCDLGRVGRVVSVDPAPIRAVTDAGFIPVIAPIGVDSEGITHNVNADEAAGAVAAALEAEKLILLTDVEGIRDSRGELITQLSIEEVRKHIEEGAIREGMIPKVECCIEALERGVQNTHIIDGRVLHAVLLEMFTDGGVGTLLTH